VTRVRDRTAAGIAWTACGLALALISCSIVLAALNGYDLWSLDIILTETAAALVGGLVASRQPRNPVGWFIIGHALCFTLGEFTRQYAIYGALTQPGSLPFARAMAWPPYWAWLPGLILLFSFLPLYFPDGDLVSRRWRPVVWIAAFLATVVTAFAMLRSGSDETRGIPNPMGVEAASLGPLKSILDVVIPGAWLILALVSVASLVTRFARSRGEERQQIKWFVFAMLLLVSYSLADVLFVNDLPVPLAIAGPVVFVTPYVAIAIAVLRYRLYDIDVVINRTLVYGALSVFLALVYFGGVTLLQSAFRALIGQESNLAIVGSTLIIAALFSPLRRRVQSFIDRRFYRRKYDASKTLEAFSARLRNETDLDRLGDELVSVARKTMQPEHISLWLRSGSGAGSRRLAGESRR
jgi:hypothetical protein